MNDEINFNIREVADQIGVTPATIRNWERKDLFKSRRDKNNYRIFNLNDIEYLKKIQIYSLEQHLNGTAIRKVMETDVSLQSNSLSVSSFIEHPDEHNIPETGEVADKFSRKFLSEKWRKAREMKKLTLEQVSKDTGISPSYLSRIENMNANLSMDIITRLSEYYGESLIYFYEDNNTEEQFVTRKNERIPIEIDLGGVSIDSLLRRINTVMRPTFYNVSPGCGQKDFHSHRGEEFIYILSGELSVTLQSKENSETSILKEEDAISFSSQIQHSWFNHTNKTCKLIWVHSLIGTD